MTPSAPFIPPWFSLPEVQRLVAAFSKKPDALRFVGGAVRDSLLGHDVHDIDAATPCLPEETMALLEQAGIKAIPTGIAHGTITAVVDGRQFEITTLRSDVACDGRHAQVAYTDSWKQDAARRDFTINALYLSPQGRLDDYFDGAADLKAGRVRFIGDPVQRIAEDRLRILRFFRFHARFAQGSIDSAALGACKAAAPQIDALSGERIQKELLALLALKNAGATLAVMETHGILEHALGFTSRCAAYLSRCEEIEALMQHPVAAHLKLMFFIQGQPQPAAALTALAARLRLSNHMLGELEILLRYLSECHLSLSEARQKQLIRRMGKALFMAAVIFRWSAENDEVAASHPCCRMIHLAQSWQPPEFPVRGEDLLAAGMTPGKALGAALQRLEQAWEDADYTLGKNALLALL